MNSDIQYVKAVGIILMVLGHSGCSVPYVTQILYMFHMPIFFFFSGYCFKTKYLNQSDLFLWRRIKGIYWPYVKWSLVFLFFHNVFCYLQIYNAENGVSFYSADETMSRAYIIVTHMIGHDPLVGGFWFLRALLYGSVLSFVLLKVIAVVSEKLKISDKLLELLALALTIVLSMIINHYEIVIPYFHCGSHATHAATFFLIGHYSKKYELRTFSTYEILIASAIVVTGSFFWRCDMNALYYQNWKMLCFIPTAFMGTWSVYSLFMRRGGRAILWLDYVGKNTLTVLTWHFLCFKLVSFIIIQIYGLQIVRLGMNPTMNDYAEKGWWLGYFIVGLSLPLFCSKLFVKVKQKS